MKTFLPKLSLAIAVGALLSSTYAAELPGKPNADVPLKIIEKINPVYPIRMLNDGYIRGEAQIVFLVDAAGQLGDCLVTTYTQKEFANVALHALKKWKFEPAKVQGQPVSTVVDMTFLFEINGVVTIERQPTSTIPYEEAVLENDKYAFQPCPTKLLDGAPKPIRVTKPVYPKEFGDQGITGKVVIEFYIDEQGRARLPIAIQASHPTLAALAISAVEQWQFEPPTRKGQPVLVCASQEFTFVPGK
jgi:TonB family protein